MQIFALDPEAEDFQDKSNEIASQIAEKAKSRALGMADIYKQVSLVLTPEQKPKVSEMVEKRMKKMQINN